MDAAAPTLHIYDGPPPGLYGCGIKDLDRVNRALGEVLITKPGLSRAQRKKVREKM